MREQTTLVLGDCGTDGLHRGEGRQAEILLPLVGNSDAEIRHSLAYGTKSVAAVAVTHKFNEHEGGVTCPVGKSGYVIAVKGRMLLYNHYAVNVAQLVEFVGRSRCTVGNDKTVVAHHSGGGNKLGGRSLGSRGVGAAVGNIGSTKGNKALAVYQNIAALCRGCGAKAEADLHTVLHVSLTVKADGKAVEILHALSAWPPQKRILDGNAAAARRKARIVKLARGGMKGCYRTGTACVTDKVEGDADIYLATLKFKPRGDLIDNGTREAKYLHGASHTDQGDIADLRR